MARAYLIPGYGYFNETGTRSELFVGGGYVNETTSSGPAEGSILIHHKRRGQPGSVMRGTGLAGGGGLVQ